MSFSIRVDPDNGNIFVLDGVSSTQIGTGGATHTAEQNLIAGERQVSSSTLNWLAAVPECEYTAWTATAGADDTIVTSDAAILLGVFINAALTGDVAIRDGTTAGGTLILTTGSTLNTLYEFPGIKCDNGIFIDDNATAGSILVFWRLQ